LGRALAGEPIDRVYASDLRRARETAEAIARPHGLTVHADARLREFHFGAWEGLTWDEIVARWPEAEAHGATGASRFAPEGGETFEAVVERVGAFVRDLYDRPDRRVVAVAHAGVIHAVLAVVTPILDGERPDPLAVNIAQASITRIAMEGGRARLITLSDVSHLDSPA